MDILCITLKRSGKMNMLKTSDNVFIIAILNISQHQRVEVLESWDGDRGLSLASRLGMVSSH